MGRKKLYKLRKIIMFSTLLMVLTGCTAKGQTKNIQEVDRRKVWKIKFNHKFRVDELLRRKISVIDKDGNKINVRVDFNKNEDTILIKPPIKEYDEGQVYTLKIEKGIYSISDAKLNKPVSIKFKVKPLDRYSNCVKIKEEDNVTSEGGKEYFFDELRSMRDEKGRKLYEDGYDGNWKVLNYYLEKSNCPKVYVEGEESTGELKLPAKINGWFSVYIGYITGSEEFKVKGAGNEETIKIFDKNKEPEYLKEAFAFAGNFKNESVSIESVKDKKARIAYIKLVGLKNEDIKLYNRKNENSKHKRVVYNNDGYSDFFWGKCPTSEDFKKVVVDSLKDADAGEVNYEVGTTGLLNYNSIYAGQAFEGSEKYDSYIREGDKLARNQILNILSYGESPLEIAEERGKEKGVLVNPSMRMNTFYENESTKFLNGIIYEKYIDCKQEGAFELSYYYPEYRDYIVNVLKEIASGENINYVNLDFCRYPKVMGKEALFEEKISIMNDFMRRIRKEIPNKKISVRVPHLNAISYGFDVETWIKEGLVDRIIPCSISYEDFYDLNKYRNMVKNTKVDFYVGISANLQGNDLTKETEKLMKEGKYIPKNKYLSVEDYLYRAHEAYKAGADGIFLFNTLIDTDFTGEYSPKFKLLGDKVKVEKWYRFEYQSYLVHDRVDLKWGQDTNIY